MQELKINSHIFFVRDGVAGCYDERMIRPVLDDEYKMQAIKDDNHVVRYIVDIGSHVGIFTIAAKTLFPAAHIIAADPDPTACECYRKNTAHLSNIHLHEVALVGDSVDTVHLRQTGLCGDQNPASNFVVEAVESLDPEFPKVAFGFEDHLWADLKEKIQALPLALQNMAEKYYQDNFAKQKIEAATVPVKAARLEALLQEHEFPYLDILKIDAEGSEAFILQSLKESGWLKKTKWVRFEWHHLASLPIIKKALADTHQCFIEELPGAVQGFGLGHNIDKVIWQS